MSKPRTLSNVATETITVHMTDYRGCVVAFKVADKLAGTTFRLLLEALSTALKFYVEEHGRPSGFLKQFNEDTGKSYNYIARLNRIRKDERLMSTDHTRISFNGCMQLLAAPDTIKTEILNRIEAGENISTADIKQQVADVKAMLSDEALEELKDDVRKEDNRIKEQRKKERKAAALEAATKYCLEDDYKDIEDQYGTIDHDVVAAEQPNVIEAEFEELEDDSEEPLVDPELNDLIERFNPSESSAPSKDIAIQLVQHISEAYGLNLIISPEAEDKR